MPSSPRLRALVETLKADFELARQIEKFLDRLHEAVEFIVTVGIVINDLQSVAEMRQRVDIVCGVGLSVAPDVFDHLAPDPRVALNLKIDFLEIDCRHFTDVFEVENFELEDEVARLAVDADADAEGRVDKPQPAELFLVRGHLRLERLEIFGRWKANRHNSMNPAGLPID